MQEIGTVISTEEGPNSSTFSFVVNGNSGKIPVRKSQFVQLETEEGLLIAKVSEVIKTNRYYQRADSVREYERDGKNLGDMFPVDRWEYLVAKAESLGVFSDGTQNRISFPPSPGKKVTTIDENILSKFLGLDENGLNIGKVQFHNLDAKLNMEKLFQKHLAILAISGAGKSYSVGVIIEEILNRPDGKRPNIVIMDPHGEYGGFAEDEKYSGMVKIFSEKNISIAANEMSATMISELLPQLSSVQKRELVQVVKSLKEKKTAYTMEDLIKAVEESEIKENTKTAAIAWLNDLNSTGLFSNIDSPSMDELKQAGRMTIFDLSDFIHLKHRQIILAYFGRKMFEARRKEKIPPYIMFVEEAHQFAPGGEEEERALSRSLIETIAREGRKFCASLVLISQRPKRLSITALSQCNTHMILRITNPIDLQHVEESSEGITQDVFDMIPGLKVGEALVVGEAVNYPFLIKVRNKTSRTAEKWMSMGDALVKFSDGARRKRDDIGAFMQVSGWD